MAGQIWTYNCGTAYNPNWGMLNILLVYNPNFGYENAVIFFPNVVILLVYNPNLAYENGVMVCRKLLVCHTLVKDFKLAYT